MTDRTKKWLKFTVRWGIAAFGVWWVLSNSNFTDRVLVLDQATNRPRYVPAVDAQEDAAEFIIAPKGEEPRRVRRDELWVRPDRSAILVKTAPEATPEKRKLLAVKPSVIVGKGRSIRELV